MIFIQLPADPQVLRHAQDMVAGCPQATVAIVFDTYVKSQGLARIQLHQLFVSSPATYSKVAKVDIRLPVADRDLLRRMAIFLQRVSPNVHITCCFKLAPRFQYFRIQ